MEELVLDGNAIGGLLGEVFAVDVTAAGSRCSGCGARAEVGGLRVYVHAMGAVVRCPAAAVFSCGPSVAATASGSTCPACRTSSSGCRAGELGHSAASASRRRSRRRYSTRLET
jgi:hypothetical protein